MTNGISYIYVETHNWGKTVKFWQQMGFELQLDLGSSGTLVHPAGGSSLFIQEVPADRALEIHMCLAAPDDQSTPGAPAVVTKTWHDSHWGTRLLNMQDPDGRAAVIEYRP
ncbi:MAG: VOC family protein [Candidatus Eisenbacteria bacterium]|uniref:VOC family protein n=1 Tax=Eiseniibacteriota bacterium TaxID=2212470 RepID=A0A956LX25_UNCEI|nr:VOC family protein [Candidatus Eisenbacteria bacterium]